MRYLIDVHVEGAYEQTASFTKPEDMEAFVEAERSAAEPGVQLYLFLCFCEPDSETCECIQYEADLKPVYDYNEIVR